MITTKTVLVLGAGASYPYHFPLGTELSSAITAELGPNGWVKRALLNCGVTLAQMDEFSTAFLRSRLYSIDSFLARRPDFAFVAKATIAGIIRVAENSNRLLGPTRNERNEYDRSDDWYRYLWSKLSDSWEHFDQNRLKIITFNYDRSLEHYLLDAMMNTFDKSEAACRDKLGTIPIEHVYGAVGGPFGVPADVDRVTYFTQEVFQEAAARLQVIPEGRNDAEHLARCRAYLAEADTICYLGFSFDPTNLERLDTANVSGDQLPERPFPRLVAGTALGLKPMEANAAAKKCGVTMGIGSEQTYPTGFPPLKCEALLRTKLILD